jgi:hypothetical protein
MYRYGMDASDQNGSTQQNTGREDEERKCLAQGIVAVTTLGINSNMIM